MKKGLVFIFGLVVLFLAVLLVSNLMAEPTGITKLPDGVIIIDDVAFPQVPPAGTVEKDSSAYGGTFARLNGKFPWNIAPNVPHNLLEEGREYLVEDRIRVKPIPGKNGWAGSIGVYDFTSKHGIGHSSFTTQLHGKDWVDFRVVSFIPTIGDDEKIWVGGEAKFVEYIDVDCFKLIPQPFPALDAYRNMFQEKMGSVGMFVRAGKSASSGIELVDIQKELSAEIYIGTSSDPNLWSNGWAGLVVDYYVPGKGYTLRRLYSAGKGWRGTLQVAGLTGGITTPQNIEYDTLPGDSKPYGYTGEWTSLSLNLASNVPTEWNGRVRLTLVVQGTKDRTSLGLVSQPSNNS